MNDNQGQPKSSAKLDYRSSNILGILLPAVYVSVLIVLCFIYKVWPTPELIVLCFFIYAAYNKRTHRFVRDWVLFVSVILSYEAMNAVVGSLSKDVHVEQPINADLQIFGAIPTLVLQQSFRTPFLDFLAAFFYSLHFIAPVAFAFILWKYSPRNFQRYVTAFAIGTYAALFTFLAYPVAPPWWGLNPQFNRLWKGPVAQRILMSVDNSMGSPFYKTIFDYVSSNKFAAFPSLHAMYPWIISLYALKIKKARALPILVFPAGVWFSAVYLGEHYGIDIIGGAIYGTCAFLLAEKLVPFIGARWHAFRLTNSNKTTNPDENAGEDDLHHNF
jgi:membrane-associated phospholipid phosphatase